MRTGRVGRLKPDVGTAELMLWLQRILSWSSRPDQTVPISSSLNLASPPCQGTQGFSGGILCSFEEKCCIASFATRAVLGRIILNLWNKGSLQATCFGKLSALPPRPSQSSLHYRGSQAHHFPATLAGSRCANWVCVTSWLTTLPWHCCV